MTLTEAKTGVDILKSQKAAAYQLKSYCLGMNQLTDLSNRRTRTLTPEQNELMGKMKNTIGVAVLAMKSHIKAGTIWCPKSEEEMEKTPNSDNSSCNNERRRGGSELSQPNSVAHKLLDSEEKKVPNEVLNESPISEQKVIIKKDSFVCAEGGESTNNSASGPESVDEDENNISQPMQASSKQKCCAGSHCARQQILPSFAACVVAALKMPAFIVVNNTRERSHKTFL